MTKLNSTKTSTNASKKSKNSRATDRFDPSRLRLSQNFVESVGVKKALLTVPVRKPGRQDFVRTTLIAPFD